MTSNIDIDNPLTKSATVKISDSISVVTFNGIHLVVIRKTKDGNYNVSIKDRVGNVYVAFTNLNEYSALNIANVYKASKLFEKSNSYNLDYLLKREEATSIEIANKFFIAIEKGLIEEDTNFPIIKNAYEKLVIEMYLDLILYTSSDKSYLKKYKETPCGLEGFVALLEDYKQSSSMPANIPHQTKYLIYIAANSLKIENIFSIFILSEICEHNEHLLYGLNLYEVLFDMLHFQILLNTNSHKTKLIENFKYYLDINSLNRLKNLQASYSELTSLIQQIEKQEVQDKDSKTILSRRVEQLKYLTELYISSESLRQDLGSFLEMQALNDGILTIPLGHEMHCIERKLNDESTTYDSLKFILDGSKADKFYIRGFNQLELTLVESETGIKLDTINNSEYRDSFYATLIMESADKVFKHNSFQTHSLEDFFTKVKSSGMRFSITKDELRELVDRFSTEDGIKKSIGYKISKEQKSNCANNIKYTLPDITLLSKSKNKNEDIHKCELFNSMKGVFCGWF